MDVDCTVHAEALQVTGFEIKDLAHTKQIAVSSDNTPHSANATEL